MPAIARFDAPPHWRAIDFISDLHLDAQHPATFAAWRQHLLNTPADAVFLLGDVFEAWVGDDARFEGFDRECADVLREAAQQRHIAFMVGNRDFLVGDTLLRDCGVHKLDDPTLLRAWQQCLLLTHGDALCIADVDYQRFRAMARQPAWQAVLLAKPLAERRVIARHLRETSEAKQAGQDPSEWADADPALAVQWLQEAGCAQMVHGHTHQPGTSELAPGFIRHVLSDWDLDAARPRAEVLRVTSSGLQRLTPADALAAC